MGLGDEIMALGRAEKHFERTGERVSICAAGGYPRYHDAWCGNPAWVHEGGHKIIDGASVRPYHIGPLSGKGIWVLDHRPRAGKVWLTKLERDFAVNVLHAAGLTGKRFAVVGVDVKPNASVNKNWGLNNWQAVIDKMSIPVVQLLQSHDDKPLRGAIGIYTSHFRQAMAVIRHAALVMCNEGGNHHMAASMSVQAVVIFGAFIPPAVTGYDFHHNIAIETAQGYCGNFGECSHCNKAMALITPAVVLSHVKQILNGK